ncbi:MAG: hypothetical protein BWY04_00444 [candidate division CPR1 bacterium ADurb.Bin160]|jgi:hypothetical protein|uniref:Uncharacterized protein n=1 Tax=candidate division CPR1 bacterium ADurb.Bin160 TaxID=1852826 RepID=A0A1V5ZPB7_9BACT|nr:MAG: hypothetical protein BWY04_00444 [candidate division CPR1 bacterium ADurb.Bin160]
MRLSPSISPSLKGGLFKTFAFVPLILFEAIASPTDLSIPPVINVFIFRVVVPSYLLKSSVSFRFYYA